MIEPLPWPRQTSRFLGILAGLLLAVAARADLTTLETIELRYRTAAEVLPVVEPLVRAHGTVTGSQNLLILRTTPSNLAEIRQVVEAVDRMPRRLRITVLHNVDRGTRERLLAAGGRVSFEGVAVEVPAPSGRRGANVEIGRGDDFLRGRGLEQEAVESKRRTQQVHTLEGSPAFIVTGQSWPPGEPRVVRTPYGERVEQTTAYRDLAAGFYVLPRVSGERVTLEVSYRREGASRGSAELAQASTVVTGRLGDWIGLGAAAQGRDALASGVGSHGGSSESELRTILLRVEEIR